MPPELIKEVRAWLVKATRDLEAAEQLLVADNPLLDIVVYHCQQSMEKGLKAFLTSKESPFAKTHALVLLVEQAAEHDGAFDQLAEHAEILTPFAWRFRSPGEVVEPNEDEAREAVGFAREALEFVLQRVPEEAHP